ncbi:MAG: AEC family transporter [Lachnospiraceae bacterium]|nr:AEC family transporter [Lachnospiraceae bacterium]
MSVVATSVIILFALIFLGFFLGKGKVVKQDSIPDLSNLVLKVTMPVTVFCSIVDQQGESNLSMAWQMIVGVIIFHGIAFVITFVATKLMRVPQNEEGVWLFSGMLTNNGFMGLPLALAVFGTQGMFLMAMGNVISNLIIFSVGLKLITMRYPIKNKISLRQMLLNNINIAVVLGFIFLLLHIPMPAVLDQLLTYLANITSGLSMLVVGLSLSRLAFKDVFSDKKMFVLPVVKLLIIPLVVILLFWMIPIPIDPAVKSVLILTAALPSASVQSMFAEQYGTNTAAASRAVFLTTLFSVVTVPLLMMLAL